jgi:ABC-type amino acid transport system permease subunit
VWLDTQHAGGMIFFVAATVLAITSPLGQAAGFFTLAAVVIAIAASVFVYSRNREKRFISSSR